MCNYFKHLTKAILQLYFKGTAAQLGELVPPIQAISVWGSKDKWVRVTKLQHIYYVSISNN